MQNNQTMSKISLTIRIFDEFTFSSKNAKLILQIRSSFPECSIFLSPNPRKCHHFCYCTLFCLKESFEK